MAKDTKELRQKRAQLIKDARSFLDGIEKDGRKANAEDNNKFNAMMADADSIQKDYENEERLAQVEKDLNQSASQVQKPSPQGDEERSVRFNGTPEYRSAFEKLIRRSKNFLNVEEFRALNIGTDTEGGYAIPTTTLAKIIVGLKNNNIMRGLGTILSVNSNEAIPIETDQGEAAYDGEAQATTEDDVALGQVNLTSYKVSTIMKVSEELLQDSVFDLETYIANLYARRIGQKEESKFIAGNGVGCPTGVFGSADIGKDTASSTAIISDELLDLQDSLKAAYRRNASWILSPTVFNSIRKLKNSVSGDYMLQPGLQVGAPDMLLGKPLFLSDYAETAMTASKKVIAFGDFSYYWIADRKTPYIRRLDELYAANGQVGFRGYARNDGKLTLSEAVKVLRMKP